MIIVYNNPFHCKVDYRTPISPMPSVSYNLFFPMCIHRRIQNPLTRFSPPKASFSRCALVSVHLKGNWLEEAGFATGQPVQVSVEHGQLIIRLVENS
ncbi:SymE family type I addiction module toxin [Photorhabdus aegyptia]|uniref:SymE family type I addiction module toxin n=1 Tax=Photorhabdus aegyptia TaxID=2805098 RepID=UPI003B8A920B